MDAQDQDGSGGRPVGRRWLARTGALMAMVLLAAPACGGGDGFEAEARAEVPRSVASETDAGPAVTANDALAVDLYRGLAAADDANLIFSPYSITIALAMTRNGAMGDTRAEMDRVLHAPPGTDLDRGLNALDGSLAARNGERGPEERRGEVILRSANALWAQQGLPFEQPFLDTMAAEYGAGVALVDYRTDATGARRSINAWVSERTEEKIPELVPDGVIDDRTRLVLTNAVYFKAPWVEAFGLLGDQPFRTADGSTVSVPTMVGGEGGRYGEGPGWKAASLRYLGDELSMVVIVPDDLSAFEAGLDATTLVEITGGLDGQLAAITMPTFRFRSQVRLKDQLTAMGMPLAFSDAADFSAMTTAEQLKIADVVHEGFIAVDEEGTEAAAATAVVMQAVSGPVGENLVADRPFLFAIRDDATGALVFLGRVTDPSATSD